MAERSVGGSIAHGVLVASRWTGRQIRGEVVRRVGGAARARVIVLFGLVLALNGADAAMIGAIAPELQSSSMHIGASSIGLLSSVALLVGAVATIPVGLLVDRIKRIPMLSVSIVLWSISSLLSAFAGSYSTLLLTRLLLGAVVGTAGPAIASLTGDYFPARERGRIYAYILGGEIAGNAVGFIVCGNIAAAIGWQAAFVVLAIPGFFLARELYRTVPEPLRGGQSHLEPGAEDLVEAAAHARARAQASSGWLDDEEPEPERDDPAREAARRMGLEPDPKLVLTRDPRSLSLIESIRYTLSIPSNVTMIISSSLGYFFFSGLTTFAVLFVTGHYRASPFTSDLVLALMVAGALIGTLVSGWLGDLLLRRGRLTSRMWMPAVCYLGAAVFLIPGFISTQLTPALWFDVAGAALISAANPPLNAARLDIMPAGLWGRAEAVRTVVRSLAQALAPLLFGVLASLIAGFYPRQAPIGTHPSTAAAIHTAHGLEITFLILLTTLGAAGIVLLRGRHNYPHDVATAGASNQGSSGEVPGVRPRSETVRAADARTLRRERREQRRGGPHRWD